MPTKEETEMMIRDMEKMVAEVKDLLQARETVLKQLRHQLERMSSC